MISVCSGGCACRKHLCFSLEIHIHQRRLFPFEKGIPDLSATPQAKCFTWHSFSQACSFSRFSQAIQPLVRSMQDSLLHTSSPEVQGEQLCLAERREDGSCSEQGQEWRRRCGAPLNPWCSSVAAGSADLCVYYLTAMAVARATWQVRTHLNYNQMTTLSTITTWIIQDDHSSYS